MKRRISARLLSLAMAMSLTAALALPVRAAESRQQEEPTETREAGEEAYEEVRISSARDLAALADRCRLDRASRNLKVTLTRNISLTEYPNLEIPTFGGIFDGGGHKITGFVIDGEGSAQGLFRYVQKGGTVKDLEVVGRLCPTGSASQVGGIVGVNSGTIESVSFSGSLKGANRIGGIAGVNEVSGKLQSCSVKGYVRGEKVVGGIVGENKGVMTNCANRASVNTDVPDDALNLGDMTVSKIISEETVLTGSDIGGVAGTSTGVVRLCRNEGAVGYPHVGYNVGGVVGSSKGFMADCVNYGNIQARKDGGGVLGQMEPNNVLEYSEDTLQKLDRELQNTNALLSRMSADASNMNGSIKGSVANVEYQVNAFVGSIYYLIDLIKEGAASVPVTYESMDDDFGFPSIDVGNIAEIWAAAGAVGSNLTDVVRAFGSLSDSITDQSGVLVTDMQDLTGQISRIINLLSGRETNDNLAQDVSGQNVEQDSAGKIRGCLNYGDVDVDINAGGIVGALSWENDLDPEDDLSTVGNTSTNFTLKTRALVYQCVNRGTVRAKKQVAGGIAGQSTLGAVISCQGYGTVDARDADWVGGIVGSSQAEVSDCWAKCGILGESIVGGIAGEASCIKECRSLVNIDCGGEFVGAIAGKLSDDSTVNANYFVDAPGLGGVDGISYSGTAEPRSYESFMRLENVPDSYRKMVLTFLSEDAAITRRVDYGKNLTDIPEVPEKEGYSGVWAGLEPKNVRADQRVFAEYTPLQGSAASQEQGQPLILAEGSFPEGQSIRAEEMKEGLPGACQFGWTVTVPRDGRESHILHLKKPDKTRDYKLFLDTGEGWQEIASSVDGSYLVFEAAGEHVSIAVQKEADGTSVWLIAGTAAALLAAGFGLGMRKKRKAKKV